MCSRCRKTNKSTNLYSEAIPYQCFVHSFYRNTFAQKHDNNQIIRNVKRDRYYIMVLTVSLTGPSLYCSCIKIVIMRRLGFSSGTIGFGFSSGTTGLGFSSGTIGLGFSSGTIGW